MEKLTRRGVMALGAGGFASSVIAADRPESRSADGWFGARNIHCNNAGVPISETAGRLAQVADFSKSNRCELIEDSFEGPYFMCTGPVGKDISGGRDGAPLAVALQVQNSDCSPIGGASVDIWACDARGNYSGYTASPDLPAQAGDHVDPETSDRFCRGVLATDADGIAEFDTIYPGYYAGRAIHIHFKLHVGDKAYVTNQALMPEKANALVLTTAPYADPRGTRRIPNSEEPGFAEFSVVERQGKLLALLTVAIDE